jgi:hypothetical protein
MVDDEIMQQVRKAKAKVAQRIGGKGFENYVAYFQKKEAGLKARGIKLVNTPLNQETKEDQPAQAE